MLPLRSVTPSGPSIGFCPESKRVGAQNKREPDLENGERGEERVRKKEPSSLAGWTKAWNTRTPSSRGSLFAPAR